MSNDYPDSSYLQYLPATFQTQKIATAGDSPSPSLASDPLLGRFLLAFERILSGLNTADPPLPISVPQGIEQLLAWIPNYFVPNNPTGPQTPDNFLPWLAGWVALSLRGDWSIDQQRSFI